MIETRHAIVMLSALLMVAVARTCLATDQAAAVEGQPSPAKARPRHHHPEVRNGLEHRVALLTRALDLDAAQQAQLRRLLENQRKQVSSIWDDETMPAANRVSATQALSDRTADQIRALLNDEQKKKYNPPRQKHDMAESSSPPSVEDWISKTGAN